MDAFHQLHPTAGVTSACSTLGINRAAIYRRRAPERHTMPPKPRSACVFALSQTERQDILDILDSERFVDVAPATIYATLLDEGRYHGSVRTIYRVLESANQTGERRRQRKHPVYTKPELLAIEPNQVWSWDITKLRGRSNGVTSIYMPRGALCRARHFFPMIPADLLFRRSA